MYGIIRGVSFSSLLKEAYKLHTGRKLELHDVAQFLHGVLESAFVGNCFDFRFSSIEERVRLSDLLEQSGQRDQQTLVTCGFKAPGSHLSCTVLTVLKCRFPVLQNLFPLPPSPILPPAVQSGSREQSSSFTLCGTPHDGLSACSLVGLESISSHIHLHSCSIVAGGNTTPDCSSFHLPAINLGPNHSDFTSTLPLDNCSTPNESSTTLVFSQLAWNEFNHSQVHSPDNTSTSHLPLCPGNMQVLGSCLSPTLTKDKSTPLFASGSTPLFTSGSTPLGTSPELFSEPHNHMPQSGRHFVTPCVPKMLRRRILSQQQANSPTETSLNQVNCHSPDLFTP